MGGDALVGATAEQLLDRFTDLKWRAKYVDITDLIEILRDCIIPDDYSIPDDLNEGFVLSEAGNAMKSRLIRKEEVPAKEAHLMCVLSIGHDELYIDVEQTDASAVAASIGRQIRDRELRFPFIYERALYDAFADAFEDEKDQLGSEETIRLLDSVPMGVFQYGRYIIGPSGVTESKYGRALKFSKRVPAYHCADPVCRELHPVVLSTGHNAEINAQRHKLVRVLESQPAPEADWSGLAFEISRLEESHFGNYWMAPVVTLIGDALSMEEVRALLRGIHPDEDADVEATRPLALERALQTSDADLARQLDELVLCGDINVPLGEVRAPVSTAHLRSGAYRLQPQLGARGIRFVSGDRGLATLRERDLMRKIYPFDNDHERNELEWQLRSVDGVSLEGRLDEYLRTATPHAALSRLILSRHASAVAASEIAGIGDLEGVDDDELIARLAWKLGFEDADSEDGHALFWRQHERLSATVQSWLGASPGDNDELKGQASVYFASLEGILSGSLAFASWALLRDHSSAPRPFEYDDEDNHADGLSLLQGAYNEWATNSGEVLRFTGRVTMYSLVRGFGTLAQALRAMDLNSDQFIRADKDLPDFARRSTLQVFPFRSRVPFLDLAVHSKKRIIEGLDAIEQTLNAKSLSAIRNDYSHYRRTSPELASMEAALEDVGQAIRAIENLGFGLNLCRPSAEVTDAWGRKSITFAGPRSMNHVFSRPSSLEWVGLPSLRKAQYLVRSAAFDDANEVLRFVRRYDSSFSRIWDDYPKPRRLSPPAVDGSLESSRT